MRRIALISSIVFATLIPRAGLAQGINLSWDDCFLGGGHSNRQISCDSDAGTPYHLIVSLDTPDIVGNVIGAQGTIVMEVDGPALPDFWRLDPGGCRAGALTANPNVGWDVAPFNCPAVWSDGGGATGGVTFYYLPYTQCAPNRAVFHWNALVANPITFDPNIGASEFYLTRLSFARNGTTTCSGCAIATCMTATEVRLLRPAGSIPGDLVVTQAAIAQNVTTQGGGSVVCPPFHGLPDCPVPARNATWGQVKSMYR